MGIRQELGFRRKRIMAVLILDNDLSVAMTSSCVMLCLVLPDSRCDEVFTILNIVQTA